MVSNSELLVGKIFSSLVDFDRSLRSLQQPVYVDDIWNDSGKKDEDIVEEMKNANEENRLGLEDDDDTGRIETLAKRYQLVTDVLDRCMYLIAVPWLSGQVFVCGSIIPDALISLAATVNLQKVLKLMHQVLSNTDIATTITTITISTTTTTTTTTTIATTTTTTII